MLIGAPFDELVQGLDEKYGIESAINEIEQDKHPLSKLYFFSDPSSGFAVNSGFMIMNRYSSQHCLDLWRGEGDPHGQPTPIPGNCWKSMFLPFLNRLI